MRKDYCNESNIFKVNFFTFLLPTHNVMITLGTYLTTCKHSILNYDNRNMTSNSHIVRGSNHKTLKSSLKE